MSTDAKNFRVHLTNATGLTDDAISAAWPEWWSDSADTSPSAQAELRFTLARKLGLDPTSLLDEETPHFVWEDFAKYKNFTGDITHEHPAITSFGISVSRIAIQGVEEAYNLVGQSANSLRKTLLKHNQYIRLQDLLVLLWGVGVPVIHLRVYPLKAKRMCAMAVRQGTRHCILLAKDTKYPASIAYYLAHELGHIALGHIAEDGGLVDMDDTLEQLNNEDPEEVAADKFALELLTGDPDFAVEKQGRGHNAKELAAESISKGNEHGIEPGTLAMCYGHSTGEWGTVHKALTFIYSEPIPAWSVVNRIASHQTNWDEISDESSNFLRAVMGSL